jgi:hypothetical protein
MTRVEIHQGRLRVEVLGWDKLWAFKSRLDFPLEHVFGMRRWEKGTDRMTWRWIRAPGTQFPGVITAGTYHGNGERVFYDVHDFENAIVIELKDEWFSRLIVEVPEPDELLRRTLINWV